MKYKQPIQQGKRSFFVTIPKELIQRLGIEPLKKNNFYELEPKQIYVWLSEERSKGRLTGRIIIEPVNPNYQSKDELINDDELAKVYTEIITIHTKEEKRIFKNKRYDKIDKKTKKKMSKMEILRENLSRNYRYTTLKKRLSTLATKDLPKPKKGEQRIIVIGVE